MAELVSTCVCGDVSFNIKGNAVPLWSVYCHCESCRKSHSAPFVSDCGFKAEDVIFDLENPPEDCMSFKASDKGPTRWFCDSCGTRVLIDVPSVKAVCVFPAITPGLAEKFPPTGHIHYQEKVISIKDGLPKHRVWPPFSPDDKVDLIEE
mmetsp:Transcript_13628/g.38720  ORF Transcript_13628/g.38720 Transcript_13628/m.38720 type:complete len:150 (+) Transcript_13628:49-498(+)|eukprot:CAMPEP_0119132156 /NCGR_PEP_ID=MMETSP1310-20130426/11642_1 /TAXON_ID=464262 /ORGANISM="Genus nov. species nov., Strain RCC2339" /LENGTH=149 /DNA_ID=CAMNT_0007122773 /DNA_START=44 /DNA_END=493 /DNA_ORIENTATION=+